ncbi:MAG: threonine ammonia-lyase [Acidobacteriia bacterium]|nr:threonine ammonia-lyase [Terriglobia bacterium]
MLQPTAKEGAPNLPIPALPATSGVTLNEIRLAAARIREAIPASPCTVSRALSELTGGTVFLKLENLQRTGSYKERGALNRLLALTPAERQQALVTASAGNHAQAVAYHAARLSLKAEIWMPLTTPLIKVSATRAWGAEVVLEGTNFDDTFGAALERCRQNGAIFIHPFDDERVMAGQGTLALELVDQLPKLDAVVVPVGGGGLIAGIAVALKEINPSIQVIGVQTALLPSMLEAVKHGKPVHLAGKSTIADGIAVRSAGEKTMPIVARLVDDLVLVDEEEIAAAVLLLLEREKTLAEGAGAVAVAALMHGKLSLAGKRVAAIVSGGNMDVTLLSRIIERGLVKDGRLVRLRIPLPDHPGALHRLTEVIARNRVNIVETSYHRAFHGAKLSHTVIDLTMETRGHEHCDQLIRALEEAGYEHERIV